MKNKIKYLIICALISFSTYSKISMANQSLNLSFDTMVSAFDSKCRSKLEACFLNECDLKIDQCRADHLILFRGFGRYSGTEINSGLKKTCDSGSEFCPHADFEMAMNKLTQAVDLLRPLRSIPPENNELVLITKESKLGWYYRYDEYANEDINQPYIGKNGTEDYSLDMMAILFLTHQNGSFLKYLQSENNKIVSLDPFISFSTNPYIAMQFARQSNSFIFMYNDPKIEPPRLVVASIKESDLTNDCTATPKQPGVFLNPLNCGSYNGFHETEFPAFYSVSQNNILANLPIPPRYENLIPGCSNDEYSWVCILKRDKARNEIK